MIVHANKFIFIHIPKTGGSTISHCLRELRGRYGFKIENGAGAGHLDNINEDNIHKYQDYFVFATHRNPWDRMVSAWKFWTAPGIVKGHYLARTSFFEYNELRSLMDRVLKVLYAQNNIKESFKIFCSEFVTKVYSDYLDTDKLRPCIYHLIAQSNLNGHHEYLKVNKWMRFSHLNEDFIEIMNKFNMTVTKDDLVYRNKSRLNNFGLKKCSFFSSYHDYYDNDTKRIIEDISQKDIEQFGYKFK